MSEGGRRLDHIGPQITLSKSCCRACKFFDDIVSSQKCPKSYGELTLTSLNNEYDTLPRRHRGSCGVRL